ncbi:lytic polysaccharide monooxygenase auxiliary activity family 9 protein [Sphaerisporangium perillae]|uniref:lytic polysaccharide monooxygenase auxiliary activity family 9 protein n=1 Tax=Sphaerisporangium perillae TaxID=2935860 RepID=UPI00200CC9C7|nr:lytic polysaccharide monooxygenase [Sphaerisporangium perillae]
MKTKAKVAILTAVAVVAAGLTTFGLQRSAFAHGALQAPASRTYACYTDGLTPSNEIKPKNPACAQAVAVGGTQPLYDWYGVLRSDGGGRTRGFIPDGKLCSGGFAKYAAYDAPGADWPATVVQPGATFDFVYGAWVPHPGGFKLYVTKDGYNPTEPLTWNDIEEQPFLTADPEPGVSNGAYRFSGRLPNKSGRHLIYSVWYRSDSQETFYGCSDVIFGGVDATPPPSSPPQVTPAPTVTPSTPPAIACAATVTVANSWSGGFQATATIKNTGNAVLSEWYIQWMMPMGITITQAWNGTSMQNGPSGMIHAPSWAPKLAPGESATAGFLATMTGATPPTFTDIGCG